MHPRRFCGLRRRTILLNCGGESRLRVVQFSCWFQPPWGPSYPVHYNMEICQIIPSMVQNIEQTRTRNADSPCRSCSLLVRRVGERTDNYAQDQGWEIRCSIKK